MSRQTGNMDRSWMKASRISEKYEHGVEQLLQFIEQNAQSFGEKFFVHVLNV